MCVTSFNERENVFLSYDLTKRIRKTRDFCINNNNIFDVYKRTMQKVALVFVF